MKLVKAVILILLISIVIILGAWREILFININAQILYLNGGLHSSGLIDSLSFLANWEIETLSSSKWMLTIFFTLAFFGISVLTIWILYKDKKKVWWLLYLYLALFVISGIFFVLGGLFHIEGLGYTIARRCMGALQSPFPVMILVPAFHLLDLARHKSLT